MRSGRTNIAILQILYNIVSIKILLIDNFMLHIINIIYYLSIHYKPIDNNFMLIKKGPFGPFCVNACYGQGSSKNT